MLLLDMQVACVNSVRGPDGIEEVTSCNRLFQSDPELVERLYGKASALCSRISDTFHLARSMAGPPTENPSLGLGGRRPEEECSTESPAFPHACKLLRVVSRSPGPTIPAQLSLLVSYHVCGAPVYINAPETVIPDTRQFVPPLSPFRTRLARLTRVQALKLVKEGEKMAANDSAAEMEEPKYSAEVELAATDEVCCTPIAVNILD